MYRLLTITALTAIATAACRTATPPSGTCTEPEKIDIVQTTLSGIPPRQSTVRQAIIYKTDGDYSDNVPITIDEHGTIISYPDPTDITPSARPIPLADGYLLDRRGITRHSIFTRYTYRDYAALPHAPTADELKSAILTDSRISELVILPITAAEAQADTAKCNRLIREGLRGCTKYSIPGPEKLRKTEVESK